MADGYGVGGVGTKPKPLLLSVEVSSLVRVQEDRFTQWVIILYSSFYVDCYDYTFRVYKIPYCYLLKDIDLGHLGVAWGGCLGG